MPNKKFTMDVPFECSLIECQNRDCGMKFILYGIIVFEKPDEYDNEHEDMVMPQSATHYCPYCGEKQAREQK